MKKSIKKAILSCFLIAALVITGAFAFLTSRDNAENVFTMGKVKIELCEDEWYDAAGNLKYDKKEVNKSLSELEAELVNDGYSVTWNGLKQFTATKDDETLSYLEENSESGTTVYESNGVNDFAEDVLPTQKIPKAPYIKNVGNNNTYAYINISIPVLELCLEYSDEITKQPLYQTINKDGEIGINEGWTLLFSNEGEIVDGQEYNTYVYAYDTEIEPGEQTEPLFNDVKITNFKNTKVPVVNYTSNVYVSTDKEAASASGQETTTTSPLMISPIITAQAYNKGDDISEDNCDQKIIINYNEAGISTPAITSSTSEAGNVFNNTTLCRVTDLLTDDEIRLTKVYAQPSLTQMEYCCVNDDRSVSMSEVLSYDYLNDVLTHMTLNEEVQFISFDSTSDNPCKAINIVLDGTTHSKTVANHKADLIDALGTSKIDIVYSGYEITADEDYYDAFYSFFQNYENDVPSSSDMYTELQNIDNKIANGIIEDNKYTVGNAFKNILNNLINDETSNILFYRIREDFKIDNVTYNAGMYVPFYSNDGGDEAEPWGFINYSAVDSCLSPIIVIADITSYQDYIGDFTNISMDATGYGIQTTAGEDASECYFKGVAEQEWEDKTLDVIFFDPITNNIDTIKVKNGDEITLLSLSDDEYWFMDGDSYEGGSSYKIDSTENIKFIKAYKDTTKYLTFEKFSDRDEAYLADCSEYIVGSVTIPTTATVSGVEYPVTAISRGIFNSFQYLYGVTFPSQITQYTNNDFAIKNKIEEYSYIFSHCPMLKNINFENNTTSAKWIYRFAEYCDSLETFVMPDGVNEAKYTVSHCENLKELTITYTSERVAYFCPRLTKVTITTSKYGYNSKILSGCFGLNDNGEYEGIKLYVSDANCLEAGNSSTCLLVNATPQMIAEQEIYENASAGSYQYLFSYISEVHVDCTLNELLSDCSCSKGVSKLFHPIKYYDGMKSTYPEPVKLFVNDNNGDETFVCGHITISSNGSGIPYYAYINELTVEEGVTSAGSFSHCSNLSKVTMNADNCSLSLSETSDDISANQYIIGKSVSTLGNCLNGFKIDTLTIPSNVSTLGADAMSLTANNIIFEVEDGVGCTTIDQQSFVSCQTQVINLPSTLTTLGERAFQNCSASVINFSPECQLTSLPSYAFYNCTQLTTITWPTTLQTINSYAFYGCKALETLIIPDTVTTLKSNLFDSCTNLSAVYIPDSVETISGQLYYHYSSIVSELFKFYCEASAAGSSWSTSWNQANSSSYWPVIYNTADFIVEELDGVSFVYGDSEKTKLVGCSTDNALVTVPSSVQSIANNAFKGQDVITVVVPDTVNELGSTAFSDVANVIYSGSVEDTNNDNWGASFKNCYDDGTAIYSSADKTELLLAYKLTDTSTFVIPETVVTISDRAFSAHSGTSSLAAIDIPASVQTIGIRAFAERTNLATVTFSKNSSLISIGEYAFYGDSALKNLNIPEGITEIAPYTFYNCYNISELTIPSTVISIGNHAFYTNYKIKELVVPDNVQTIGNNAFYGWSYLETLTLGKNLVSLGSNVFEKKLYKTVNNKSVAYQAASWNTLNYNVINLASGKINCDATVTDKVINISKDVEVIPAYFLGSGSSTYELNVTVNFEEDSKLVTIGNYSFYKNDFGSSGVSLPNTVEIIGDFAFCNCTTLTSIDIPSACTSIGASAFSGCTGLTKCNIVNNMETLGENAFYNCTAIELLNVPSSVTSIGSNAFYQILAVEYHGSLEIPEDKWGAISINAYVEDGIIYTDSNKTEIINGTFAQGDIVIPSSVVTINDSAFLNNTKITSVSLPVLTSTSDNVFKGCTSLQSVEFVGTDTGSLGDSWFEGCSSLASAKAGSITTLGTSTFKGCTSLTSVGAADSGKDVEIGLTQKIPGYTFSEAGITSFNLPDTITTFEPYSFNNCPLTDIKWPASIDSICKYAFYGTSITEAIIPEGTRYLQENAFGNCSQLTTISLPSTLTSIADNLFLDNSTITTAYIACKSPSSDYVFKNCSALKTVEFDDNVTKIGEGWFYNCKALEEVSFPCNLTTIASHAFQACSYLSEADLSQTKLVSLGDSVFYYCKNLTSISFPDTLTYMGSSVFYNCSSLEYIELPANLTSIGNSCFNYCSKLLTAGPVGSGCNIEYGWTAIPSYAFYNASITSIQFPELTTSIGAYTFKGSDLTSITIPDTVTEIGKYAFSYCDRLTSVDIPDSVITIGEYAFEYCTSLIDVTIGEGVTTMGLNAFQYSKNIEYIYFNSNVFTTTYSPFLYAGTTNKTNFIFGENVTAIPDNIFTPKISNKYITFKTIHIPKTIKSVYTSTFKNNVNTACVIEVYTTTSVPATLSALFTVTKYS